MKVKGIRALKYKSALFMELFLFLLRENDKRQKVYFSFKYKLHLVQGFRANILNEKNIFVLKNFVFKIKLGHTMIGIYEVKNTMKLNKKTSF